MTAKHLLGLSALAIAWMAGCTAEPDEGEDMGDYSSELTQGCAITRSQIMASVSGGRRRAIERGFTWLDANVPYSQSKTYKGYRTDCSGFISMSWELGTSYTTSDFSSGGGQSKPIGAYSALIPGDAIVRRSGGSGHVVLFLGWNDKAKTSACVLEQASTATDMQFGVRSASSLKSGGYKAIRANKLTGETETETEADTEIDPEPTPAPTTQTPAPTPTPTPTPTRVECASDGVCNPGNNGSGKICVAGRCVPGCRKDNQCPNMEVCVAGFCQ